MSRMWRVVIAGLAIFYMLIGVGFLIDPAGSALRFALAPLGTQGLATLRADFTAFFVVAGGFALHAAWRDAAASLRMPVALLAIALLGRVVSLAADGAPPSAFPPMAVEAVTIVLMLLARRSARA